MGAPARRVGCGPPADVDQPGLPRSIPRGRSRTFPVPRGGPPRTRRTAPRGSTMIDPGVKETLPHVYHEMCRNTPDMHRIGCLSTASAHNGTNIFTISPVPLSRFPHVRGSADRPEDRLPTRPGTVPSPRREGPRRTVPRSALLRSARPAPGSLRDAPPPSGRWVIDPQGRRALRGQPPHLLPRGGGLPYPRPSRPRSAETRAEGTPSVYSRDLGLRSIAPPERPPAILGHLAPRDHPPVRRRASSSKDGGAGPRPRSKKRAPEKRPTEALALSVEPAYETLRTVAMKSDGSDPSPPGLGVFLLRGWMGWAEALPALLPVSSPSPIDRQLPSPARVDPNREVIQALAGLVLSYLGDRS